MSTVILKVFAKSDSAKKSAIEVDMNISTIKWKTMSKRQQDKVIQTRMASMFRYEISHKSGVDD
tara:strand:+ start:826 stop:1017 length:192 start_codon:yes stop_codon:yes gene_type:complete